ncbi:hypothetical protein DL546_003627 [Coniochaeta pulveracea]|uniref:Stc1 domain-containing protein n=1 Tax=Coniochaeta pulveracea TaxID=177199 RepID=A0A420Y632_9PEZI|nr:hypothetical protein DL546_003627 [Coniochaeta pulveracea]
MCHALLQERRCKRCNSLLGAREDYDWCDQATLNGTYGTCQHGEQIHETSLKDEYCRKCEVDRFMGGEGSSDSDSDDDAGIGGMQYWEDDEGRRRTWLEQEDEPGTGYGRPVSSRSILGSMFGSSWFDLQTS